MACCLVFTTSYIYILKFLLHLHPQLLRPVPQKQRPTVRVWLSEKPIIIIL